MKLGVPPSAIWLLGITQIIGYGSLYYSFSVLAPTIGSEFGWSQEWIYAALTVALLAGGLLAPIGGQFADRFGAARTMVAGSAVAAVTCVLAGVAPNGWFYAAALFLMEAASTFVLYATAFAALVQAGGRGAQRSITHLTLIAGFASTLFWPLTALLLSWLGWRGTYFAFAAMNLLICLPLHFWLMRSTGSAQGQTATTASSPAPSPGVLSDDMRTIGFALMMVGFAVEGLLLSAILMQIAPLLSALDIGAGALLVTTLFGPAQVLSRLINMVFGRNFPPRYLALIAALLVPSGIAVLALTAPSLPGAVVFAILFGLGSGLTSIVAGALPLELLGTDRYGSRLGWLSSSRQTASAIAPFAFAVAWSATGLQSAMWVTVALGTIGIAAFAILSMLVKRPEPLLSAGDI